MSPRVLATRDAIDEIKAWQDRDAKPDTVFRIDVRLEVEAALGRHFGFSVRVVVQEDGLPLIDGSVLDFEDSYRGRGFRLANPNARNACGCGTSFMADYPGGASSSLDGGEDQIVAGAGFTD